MRSPWPGTKVGELCVELGVSRQTLYRHVDPKGALRPDGKKVLEGGKMRTLRLNAAPTRMSVRP